MRVLTIVILMTRLAYASPNELHTAKVGFIAPLTGPFAQWGESLRRGAEIAQADLSHKIQFDFQDSNCMPQKTVTVGQKFLTIDQIRLIVGPGCLSGLKAIAPIAAKKKALLFSTGLIDDETVEKHSNVFNFATQISAEARAMVTYLSNIGLNSLAIVHGTNAFGEEFGRTLPIFLEQKGIKVLANEGLSLDSTDFRGVITRIMKARPEAIFLHQGESQTVSFMKQLRTQGYEVRVFSQYAVETDATLTGGPAVEGLTYTYPYNSALQSKGRIEFVNRYKKAYGQSAEPSASSFYVYDGLRLLDKALVKCSSGDTDCIARFFRNLGLYQGISGDMTFTTNRETIRPYGIKKIEDGKFKWVVREIKL